MTSRDPHETHPVDPVGDPLTFAVSGLMGEPPGTVFEYAIPPVHVELDEDLATTEPVTGRMRLTRTNRGLIVDARLDSALAGDCARCLRPIVTPRSTPGSTRRCCRRSTSRAASPCRPSRTVTWRRPA